MAEKCAERRSWSTGRKRKGKTTPFGVNLMRSKVSYWAAQGQLEYTVRSVHSEAAGHTTSDAASADAHTHGAQSCSM